MKVGVAYGSDTRKVSDTLRAQAERHGQVLKTPPPRVIFEDFGADGLQFAASSTGSTTGAARTAGRSRATFAS